MKDTDWKSFAIGVLLTTTVIACIGATSVNDKWDTDQQWEVKVSDLNGKVGFLYTDKSLIGFEPLKNYKRQRNSGLLA